MDEAAQPTPELVGSLPLFSGLELARLDADENTAVSLGLELDLSLDGSEDRVVPAHADARSRMLLRSALTDDDVAGYDVLATRLFDAKAPALGITTVAG
jgi:hypothetical protein